MKLLPMARTANIAVQNLKTEVLIYDLSTDTAFCLNETASKVFNACDGRTTFTELKNNYQLTDEIIYLALDVLKKENLIETDYLSPFAGMTRREVLRRVGLASVIALPVVSAMVAPTAAQSASGNAGACIPVGECRGVGSIFCPPGCVTPINFINYLSSTNGLCNGPINLTTLNCANYQGVPAGNVYMRGS